MIEVSFMIDANEVQNSNPLSTWIKRHWDMPWLNYLLKHKQDIKTVKFYDPLEKMYEVKFIFTLDPEKETYYILKYR
jgi:uncharacterized protein YpiB (UPF0302 family)